MPEYLCDSDRALPSTSLRAVSGIARNLVPLVYRLDSLTVTAPRVVLEGALDKASLPVMVHVHRGAFKEGSHIPSVQGRLIKLESG
jgi:hypothetical protein